MQPSTITLNVHSSMLLSANQRMHHTQRSPITRELRALAGFTARSEHIPKRHLAYVRVHVSWPDNRARDAHNIFPTIKACLDGFTDVGLWPDDNDKYLASVDVRTSGVQSGKKGITTLTFTISDTEIGELD